MFPFTLPQSIRVNIGGVGRVLTFKGYSMPGTLSIEIKNKLIF